MATKLHVLITGAAGLVGGIVRQHWGDRYRLRLADIQPISDLADHEESVELDICDLEAFTEACRDVDVVLHLAADRSPSRAPRNPRPAQPPGAARRPPARMMQG